MRSSWSILFGAVPLLQPVGAQTPTSPAAPADMVVTAHLPPRCRSLANDPLDKVSEQAPRARWLRIEPNADGTGYHYVYIRTLGDPPEESSLTAIGQWRRAGNALYSYIFRQPTDGTPLCIGRRRPTKMAEESEADQADDLVVTARRKHESSGAQLQQLIHGEPYICRSVRLTVNIATRDAAALLWMNGGFGETKQYELKGTGGWETIRLEQGPVAYWYKWTGFGVALTHGDVWIDKLSFTIIPDEQLSMEQQRAESACRTHMTKEQLSAQGLKRG